jgi:hypothetical protein
MTETKDGIFGGVSKAFDADPWGPSIIGGSIVEVLSYAITGKTIVTGALFGQKTLLLGGKGMKRKKSRR